MSNAKHRASSAEWYTPPKYVEAARTVMGGIELDPFSCRLANEMIVRADRYMDKDYDSLRGDVCWQAETAIINPPGTCMVYTASGVKRFPRCGGLSPRGNLRTVCGCRLVTLAWEKLVASARAGTLGQAIWIGFSIEQLQTLQNSVADRSPLDFPFCVPRKRIHFVTIDPATRAISKGGSPTHSNFVCGLGVNENKFREVFGVFGNTR